MNLGMKMKSCNQMKSDELTQKMEDLQMTINSLQEQPTNAEVIYNINTLDTMQLEDS